METLIKIQDLIIRKDQILSIQKGDFVVRIKYIYHDAVESLLFDTREETRETFQGIYNQWIS